MIAHLGLTRKLTSLKGRYEIRGKKAKEAKQIFQDALEMEKIGVFAVILECIPTKVAKLITENLKIPTIGVGSGPYCDGQALITQDLLNLFGKFVPKFVKQYADLSKIIEKALMQFKQEVKDGKFPEESYSFNISDDQFNELIKIIKKGY